MERTFVAVPDGGTNTNDLAGILSLACQNKGLDAASVMAMCKGRDGFGFDDIIALIVIAALFGNGNFGFGGNGNRNNDTERQMIMDAIQRNGIEISQLASTLNCSVGQVNSAINAVASQVCSVGNQVGMTGQQIINSIQQGNMSLIQQICTCCCDLKTILAHNENSMTQQINAVNVGVERGFSQLGYATRDQTCAIEKSIEAQTAKILEGQRAAEMREMQRELAERDRMIAEKNVIINNGQQSAMFAQMLKQAVDPIIANQTLLAQKIGGIECKLPETKTIQCPERYIPVNYEVNVPVAVGRSVCGGYNGFGNYNNYAF